LRERPDALFVGGDPFFNSRRLQISRGSRDLFGTGIRRGRRAG
jgi:hypothetical protein